MAYKKDQGRYARMSAFWALFALVGYGCFSGLVFQIRRWGGDSVTESYVDNLPLLGNLDLAMILTLGFLAVCGFILYTLLNKPKAADLLIETEAELKKVTWPSAGDTWKGTIAVIITVGVMLAYLFVADAVLLSVLTKFMQAAQG